MKRNYRSYIIKSLMIAAVALAMLLLCGCRTRITNNTDVSGVINDDSGLLQESYQVRRDELGIPIAESPLFLGSDDDEDEDVDYDDYDDFDSEDDEDYDDEEDEDEDDEEEEDVDEVRTTQNRTTSTTRTPTTTNRNTNRVVRRPAVTQTTSVKVTLNLNAKDAKCSKSSITVKKGSTYGVLPTPTRSGYDFEGWYTAKTKGSKVDSKTKVSTDKAHTLYAHWTETEKKKYTVTFDGNGEGDDVKLSSTEITVEEGGKYTEMPSAKRDKYKFSGWFTDPSDGSQVTTGSKIAENKDHTLYAHWEPDAYSWWENEFKTAANDIDKDSQQDCIIDGGDDTEEDFLKDCKGHIADSETTPANIIKFIKNYSDEAAADEAAALYEKYSETAPDAKIIIVSDKALKGSKEQKLLYKMMLLDILYGSGDNVDDAAADLLDGDTSVDYPYIYPEELS